MRRPIAFALLLLITCGQIVFAEIPVRLISRWSSETFLVTVGGDHAYVGNGKCLALLEISDPTKPDLIDRGGRTEPTNICCLLYIESMGFLIKI